MIEGGSSRRRRRLNGRLFPTLAAVFAFAMTIAGAQAQSTVTYTKKDTTVKGLALTIFSKPTDDSGGIIRIVTGTGNLLWFPEEGLGTIVRFSPSTAKATAFTVPFSGASVHALAEGSDNNMWFTDFQSSKVGRVTSAGKFKLFDTAAGTNMSNQMVLGPDGNVWFATDHAGIGRTTPQGRTEFFSIQNNQYQLTAITVGPKNQLWFAQWNGPNVGYVTTAGAQHEYSAGFGSLSNTFGIAYGSDGRIWFCDPQNQRIGAIKTNGTGLTFYSTGLTTQPDSIVSGPDDNLYFGEFGPPSGGAGYIGRITTKGKITEYRVPATGSSFPVLGITVGPDKNIWFSNNAHSQIGRLTIQ